jgi:hypothetical protein
LNPSAKTEWRASNAVYVSAPVLQGIRNTQATDNVNKYSVHEMIAAAATIVETEALEWLTNYPLQYLDGVFYGFIEEVQETSTSKYYQKVVRDAGMPSLVIRTGADRYPLRFKEGQGDGL